MPLNIREIRRKAEAGSCASQCMLGLCYLYGIDAEVNYKEAFRFLSAAAEQHSSRAVLNLGRMYVQGLGIQQNISEAIRHFEAVARHSDSTDSFAARVELGRVYSLREMGVPDRKLALRWYSAALEVAADLDDSEEIEEARAYVSQSHE